MAAVRGSGNLSTEMRLRTLFRANGIKGWRRGFPLYGKPDFAFPEAKIAIFVDGCFWHGCPRHRRIPKTRIRFWMSKLNTNIQRDLIVSNALRKKGWQVLRIWECDLTISNSGKTMRKIDRVLNRKRTLLRISRTSP